MDCIAYERLSGNKAEAPLCLYTIHPNGTAAHSERYGIAEGISESGFSYKRSFYTEQIFLFNRRNKTLKRRRGHNEYSFVAFCVFGRTELIFIQSHKTSRFSFDYRDCDDINNKHILMYINTACGLSSVFSVASCAGNNPRFFFA